MSPGPNFLLVSRFAASSSVRAGVGASLGIVMVGLVFSTSSVTGLALLLSHYPTFSRAATLAGAAYLIYIAFQLLRSALRPATAAGQAPAATQPSGFVQTWRTGVLTNITNMKTIAFMVSIFAGFLSVERSLPQKVAVIASCSSFEIVWYASVALVVGQGRVQRLYLHYSREIDGAMALFLLIFACHTGMTA